MCGGPKWKREVVPDHKFDFINTREFNDTGFFMRLKYLWVYLIVLKSFLVYVSDIFTAVTMLTTTNWSNEIFKQCGKIDGCVPIPFNVGKWLFVSCILVGFLLVAYEARKARKIIQSRDISYAFTNVMANNYYSLRSYDHFCFFDHISNSTKTIDDFAFFVFFTFKSWKRLLLADAPRQGINALTLWAVYLVQKDKPGSWYDPRKYFQDFNNSTIALTISSFFTVAICAGSLLLLIVAGICYIPLLLHIRGNLKEYCCHKVDKRIGDIMKRKQKERRAEAAKLAQKEAMGDFSHLKNKKGELVAQPLPQPTLPNLSVDDDDDTSSMATSRRPPPSTYTQDYYYGSEKGMDYPPMPAYNPYSTHPNPGAPQYNPSFAGYDDLGAPQAGYASRGMYDDDNDSTANLAVSGAPFARDPIDRQNSPYGTPSRGPTANGYDPADVYQGRAAYTPAPLQQHQHQVYAEQQQQHRLSPPSQQHGRVPSASSGAGLAYNDAASEYSHTQYSQSQYSQSQTAYTSSSRGPGYDEESGYRGYHQGYGGRS
jgi:hypothetical protein